MSITQQHVARKLGLSQGAVAYALSDSPQARRQLKPETRRRILEVARSMGYVPDRAARRLARGRGRGRATCFDQIGMISFGASVNFNQDVVRHSITDGAEERLAKLSASLTLVRVRETQDWEKVDRLARGGGVDGWLLYGPIDDDAATRMDAWKLPYVIVGDHRCTRPVHNVNVDNLAIGRLVARHFASLGHRRVAYLGAEFTRLYQQLIRDGFRAARRENGLDEDDRLIIDRSALKRHDPAAVVEWLQGFDPMPTAVFMPDFGIAIGVYPVLARSPIAAIREMSFVGAGVDSPGSVGQEYTSVDLRMNDVGREAVSLLHRIVTGGHAESVLVPPGMFAGESTHLCRPFGG